LTGPAKTPKVFISYCWTSPRHRAQVQEWAERLLGDGVDVVLDVYDLKEGDDKFVYMERMVTDESVTHVLVMADQEYARRADARQAGVGTESQIISSEVYDRVTHSKFIPLVCEYDDAGEPCLPTFLKSRIWVDFSTPEAVNGNWERLVRLLHGKPSQQKPERGQAPAYIQDEGKLPASPAIAKLNVLKQAVLQGRTNLSPYRRDFFSACLEHADALRVRDPPSGRSFGEKIVEDVGELVRVRNEITDWVLLESEAQSQGFPEALLDLLERLLEIKSRPEEVKAWNDSWFDAHAVFVYETVLYVVAALIKTRSFSVLNQVLASSYLLPPTMTSGTERFAWFGVFWGSSDHLQSALSKPGQQKYISPTGELLKRQAERPDLSFEAIMESELLVLLMACITNGGRWYAQTLPYSRYGTTFPLFLRATQHRGFRQLAVITGIADADALREAVKQGLGGLGRVPPGGATTTGEWTLWNMDRLDTLD
jgi:hypothetical protein